MILFIFSSKTYTQEPGTEIHLCFFRLYMHVETLHNLHGSPDHNPGYNRSPKSAFNLQMPSEVRTPTQEQGALECMSAQY